MDVTRRDFLKASSGGALAGTALGALTAVGASLAPAVAQAQELRIAHAKATQRLSLLLGRLRHAGAHDRGQDREHRGRSTQPAQ